MAAAALPKFFPMLMTAAGTIAPARVLILGAGVAGLTAIGTARRLGAVVEAFDVRKVVKEQVESLGAKFVEVESAEDAQTAGGYAKETQRGRTRRSRPRRSQGTSPRPTSSSAPRSSLGGARRPRHGGDGQVDARGRSSSISRPSSRATAS
jgi:threonine dehydrogenase-like Zn-dependent dehydrogenase